MLWLTLEQQTWLSVYIGEGQRISAAKRCTAFRCLGGPWAGRSLLLHHLHFSSPLSCLPTRRTWPFPTQITWDGESYHSWKTAQGTGNLGSFIYWKDSFKGTFLQDQAMYVFFFGKLQFTLAQKHMVTNLLCCRTVKENVFYPHKSRLSLHFISKSLRKV